MRIAIGNWTNRQLGGVEIYLSSLIPALIGSGHDVSFLCEQDEPADRPAVFSASGEAWICSGKTGVEGALKELKAWDPDVIYSHGMMNSDLERGILGLAPAVFFSHDYRNTCISGNKLFQFPEIKPCDRKFGWKCLIHYYPFRCGGWSPVTMMRLYSDHSEHLKLLSKYKVVLTHSGHMQKELLTNGVNPECVKTVPYLVGPSDFEPAPHSTKQSDTIQILFLGRMDDLKGGMLLIESLRFLAPRISKRIRVVLIGDGPERPKWEKEAKALEQSTQTLQFHFPGWIARNSLGEILSNSDLIVVPSIWPEPFGIAGLEAGLFGVPAVAFDVGGIPEWLSDGINGVLVKEISASALAAGIERCFHSPETYANMCTEAQKVGRKHSMVNHSNELLRIFSEIVS